MRRLSPAMRGRIDRHIMALADNPRPHGSLKLSGHSNTYRVRVDNHRIIYTIDDGAHTVEVGIVADRKDAYREL